MAKGDMTLTKTIKALLDQSLDPVTTHPRLSAGLLALGYSTTLLCLLLLLTGQLS